MAEMWITKDGIKMKMSEMTNGHLLNALRYFKIKQEEEPFKKFEEGIEYPEILEDGTKKW